MTGNFQGHIVSDCWALVDFYENGHNVVENEVQAAALALKRGVNLNYGSVYPSLTEAVGQGLVTEEQVDKVLKLLLRTRFKLGMFDSKEANSYNTISSEVVNSRQPQELAPKAAVKSIVLLKNEGVLPLKNHLPRYFITGPNASSVDALLGNYYEINDLDGDSYGRACRSYRAWKPNAVLAGSFVKQT